MVGAMSVVRSTCVVCGVRVSWGSVVCVSYMDHFFLRCRFLYYKSPVMWRIQPPYFGLGTYLGM